MGNDSTKTTSSEKFESQILWDNPLNVNIQDVNAEIPNEVFPNLFDLAKIILRRNISEYHSRNPGKVYLKDSV